MLDTLVKKVGCTHIIVTEPSEYDALISLKKWAKKTSIQVEIREDTRFLCGIHEFDSWAEKRKTIRMDFFYQYMRRKYDILMQNNKPQGGKWSYDSENRKPPSASEKSASIVSFQLTEISRSVIRLVNKKFDAHFGDLESFNFAVTRRQALRQLSSFIKDRLTLYGPYQDAMMVDEPYMYHSLISFYLIVGLLLPGECIEKALQAYSENTAPLHSIDGFIRQIIGWREYIRGLYWLKMPAYRDQNFFNAKAPLPGFYWTGTTEMNCLRQCIHQTKQYAYVHHIQRLMVLGNFLLLLGVSPQEANEWYWIVYADAYEWIELPNVTGMILYADGGILATKPYAAGGSYINKMSNYCKSCQYNVAKKTGSDACPFNYLYWNFLIQNKSKLSKNPRLTMMYSVLSKMDPEKIKLILEDSHEFISQLS